MPVIFLGVLHIVLPLAHGVCVLPSLAAPPEATLQPDIAVTYTWTLRYGILPVPYPSSPDKSFPLIRQ